MSKKKAPPTLYLCRGCCCGTETEHPGVDHDALEQAARDGVEPAGIRVRTTDCLGPCDAGNVVVVHAGGQRRWFGRMNSLAATEELAAVLAEQGDARRLPPALQRHVIPRPAGE